MATAAVDDQGELSRTVVRWLDLGRDVLIRGDEGAETASLLARIALDAERLGYAVNKLDGGAIDAEPVAKPARGRRRPERTDVVPRPGPQSIRGRSTVLLVDDLDESDAVVCEQIDRLLRSTSGLLVATTTLDLLRWGDVAVSKFISARAPAEVRIPPLGYSRMAEHVEARLGGPAEGPLVSSLLAWSVGIPSVASAMLDAARFSGAIVLREGIWVLAGDLGASPLDSVAYMLCGRLSEPEAAGLEQLAVMGPSSPEVVRGVIKDGVLERLISRGRVVLHGGDSIKRFAVSPPALSAALRSRVTDFLRMEVVDPGWIQPSGERAVTGRVDTEGMLKLLLATDPESRAAFARWASSLIGVIHEKDRLAEATSSAAWEKSKTLDNAVRYLNILLRRPVTDRARMVFEQTKIPDVADPGAVEMFELFKVRWHQWVSEPDGDPAPWPDSPGVVAIENLIGRILGSPATPEGDAMLAESVPASANLPEPARSMGFMLEAATLLESGRLDLALRLTDPATRPDWIGGEADSYLDGIYDLTLQQAGLLEDAYASSRRHLATAVNELDSLGIRIHTVSLAQALIMMGLEDMASTLLFTILRLGPAGPLLSSFYSRALVLAAIHASPEEATAASQLLAELRRIPPAHTPTLSALPQVAEAQRLRSEGEPEEADAMLWREGETLAEEGRILSALRTWTQRSVPPTPGQLVAMKRLLSVRRLPLNEALVAVLEAIVEGDVDAVISSVHAARIGVSPPIASAVLTFLDEYRARLRQPPLSDTERAELVGAALAGRLTRQHLDQRVATLSHREREVARMAAQGYSNREIADLLVISPKTVENHIHRALTKLGLPSRDSFPVLSL